MIETYKTKYLTVENMIHKKKVHFCRFEYDGTMKWNISVIGKYIYQ